MCLGYIVRRSKSLAGRKHIAEVVGATSSKGFPVPYINIIHCCAIRRCVLCVAKYKTLERLLSMTELPALVEQKPRSSAAEVDVFEPLTLTEKFEQTFLVVNFINDGQCLLPTPFNILSISFLQRPQCSHCKRCISYSNSVRLSVCPSVRLSHAGIVSKRRHVARCSLHRWITKCV